MPQSSDIEADSRMFTIAADIKMPLIIGEEVSAAAITA